MSIQSIDDIRKLVQHQQGLLNKVGKALKRHTASTKQVKEVVAWGWDWNRQSRISCIMLGQVLSFLKENWEDLPEAFTQEYDSEFYEFAKEEYGIVPQTVDNYVMVWDAMFSGKFTVDPPRSVNLLALPLRKLTVVARYVAHGMMNQKRWAVVANDTLNWERMRDMMENPGLKGAIGRAIGKNDLPPVLRLVRATGDIKLYNGKKILDVGFLNVQSVDAQVISAVQDIMKRARIKEVE